MLGIERAAARYTWTAAIVLLFLYLVYLLRSTLFVFALALLFAYLLSPLVDLLDHAIPRKGTRTLALTLAYLIFVGAVVLVAIQIGTRVVDQAHTLVIKLPEMMAKYEQPSPMAPETVNSLKAQVIASIRQDWAARSSEIMHALPEAGMKFLSAASNLIYVVIVPVLAFFFLKDGDLIHRHTLEMLDGGALRGMVESVMSDIHLLLAHYMRSLVLLSLATFTAYCDLLHDYGRAVRCAFGGSGDGAGVHPDDWAPDGRSDHPVGHRDFRCLLLDSADFHHCLPYVPGLFPLAAPDGTGRTTASPAGAARRFRRRGSGRCGGKFSLRTGPGDGPHPLRENPPFAIERSIDRPS